MKLYKAFKHAFGMVLHSRLRSWLTIIGIVIGVASVIAIMALGDGMEASVNAQFNDEGIDLLTISPGFSRGGGWGMRPPGGDSESGGAVDTDEEPELTRQDVQTLKGISLVKAVDTQISGQADVFYLGQMGKLTVTGVDQSVWAEMTKPDILEGRLLGPADNNVIVIGQQLAETYFDQELGINKALTVEDRAFRVVGILDGGSRSIYMPIASAYQVIDDKEKDVYDRIVAQVKDAEQVDAAREKIEHDLMLRRHVTDKDKDFSISDPSAMLETRQEMVSSMTLFLTAIAAVALVVGAVGIANTMFTSVLERTKQIGIMKAIGATRKDILFIFLFNAALIGLIGGLIGVLFGYILAQAMPFLISFGPARGGSVAIVKLSTVLMALGVSVAIGVCAGVIPAWNASKLKPVDALRFE